MRWRTTFTRTMLLVACISDCIALSATVGGMKTCPLCNRAIPPELESRHHLVPKLKGGKTTQANIVVLHRVCHDKVHGVFTEAELARSYDTVEMLLADPRIEKFAKWIAKRPINFHDSTPSLRRRRQRGLKMMEGLDAESDSVGPGIYGGKVERDAHGEIVTGQQFEEHNPLPGPVYAGGGYTELSAAIRTSADAVRAVLATQPTSALEISTGGATPLHVCGMSPRGQQSTALLAEARALLGHAVRVDAVDTWGYTALQRHATNNCADGALALLEAGADHMRPSGLEGTGQSARALARRLRAYAVLKVFQQWELARGQALPDDEIEL